MKTILFQYYSVVPIVLLSVFLFSYTAFCNDESPDSSPQIQLAKEIDKLGSGLENPMTIRSLRIEVARSGDQSERKRIMDDLKNTNPARQYEAIVMANSVRGSDMICGLAELLSDTNGYRSLEILSADQEERQDDVVFSPPSIEAAKALSEIVESPPEKILEKGQHVYTEEDVNVWKAWWADNRINYEAHPRP